MDWLFQSVVGFFLSTVPLWVWIIIAGLAIGWAWKTFGTQGIVGALAAILTLGAYRQGWNDRGSGKPPVIPVEPIKPVERSPPPAPRRKIRTVWDILNGK